MDLGPQQLAVFPIFLIQELLSGYPVNRLFHWVVHEEPCQGASQIAWAGWIVTLPNSVL